MSALPQEGAEAHRRIEWCLLSHTNIGKTTLTRTLMSDDVGLVQDAAHVTTESQRYLLQSTAEGDQLWLWDTPGFGDSVRLYERLRQQGNPLGWFLSNVWDRWRDKPFYLSQRALLAARDHADVMLYLVNAAEDPADAGYWRAEMNILAWLQQPVIVLLNQVGSDTTSEQTAADVQRWRDATAPFRETVRDVLVLDAFTRSWWHERRMMQSIAPLLAAAKQPAYERLLTERSARQALREQASVQALAQQLVTSAQLCETPDPAQGKLLARTWQQLSQSVSAKLGKASDASMDSATQAAVQRLTTALQQADLQATQQLLALHQLDGQAASQIQTQLREQLELSTPVDTKTASLWGAVTAGAATGLGADAVAGGMTLGAGALLGAVVGAVTFAGAAWGANKMWDQESQRVQLSRDYLTTLVSQALLKYIVIAHFGRGRGRYTSPAAPAQWNVAVQAAIAAQAPQWAQVWDVLRHLPVPTAEREAAVEGAQREMVSLLQCNLHRVMETLYPTLCHVRPDAS